MKQVLNSVKQVLNSVKHGHKLSKTPSNGRVNLKYSINQPGSVLEAGSYVCSYTPRFSYEGPETGVPTMRTP